MMSSSRGDDTRLAITAVRDAVAVLRLLSDPEGVRALSEQLQASYDSTIAGIEAAENHLAQRQEEIKSLEAALIEKEKVTQNRAKELEAAEHELSRRQEALALATKTQTDQLHAQLAAHQKEVASFKSQISQHEAKSREREDELSRRDAELVGKSQALDKRAEDIAREISNLRKMQIKFNDWEARLRDHEKELGTRERALSDRELAYEQRVKHLRGMLAEAEGGGKK